jgi:malate dehydrogenase (quinone)
VNSTKPAVDVALIGGGIMSATLGTILSQLEPDWTFQVFERLGDIAQESSGPWNNAGTGHSALCELNYTPERDDGSIDISSAVKVNEQFQVTRQFWAHLVDIGHLPEPSLFINSVPHMSFVWGTDNVRYLRKRWEALKGHPLFSGMEYSEDARVIRTWAPVLIPGRYKSQPIAATRILSGTDINFGSLTRLLTDRLGDRGATVTLNARVTKIKRQRDGLWRISYRREVGQTPFVTTARFIFVGAGGHALNLMQKAHIPEIKGYGGFPISGQFLRTDNQVVAARHNAKVYGIAAIGSPPMSIPHLDRRIVDGSPSLMFGPYAGFSPKFLKTGSWFDLFASIRPGNIIPMIAAGIGNLGLVWYLVTQLLQRPGARFAELRTFFPEAEPADWYPITAGQRVQVIKKDAKKRGVLQFGTEVVASADGTMAGLLGASPGASTAVPIMIDLIEQCFPDRMDDWRLRIATMIPSYGKELADDPALARETLASTARTLQIRN